ncbi:MAG: HEAT repeat domain-containing protein [Gemmatimonadales bacterium]|jgi:HEAT repeat protein
MDESQSLTLPTESADAGASADVDLETAGQIEEFVTTLLKELKARQAYVSGNPLIDRFHRAVREQALELWDELPHLTLRFDESRLLWRDHPVYDHPLGHDNFSFMFFRDGLRSIAFLPGCEQIELREFLEIVAAVRQGRQADLLATLWHRDFSLIRIEYVDVSEDEAMDLPRADRHAGAGEKVPTGEIEKVLEAGPVPPEVDDGFNALCLNEADRQYLQREMELEVNRPLAHDVTLALLDQFEMRDQERRRQVVDILRELLPRLIRDADFATVALIVNELQLLANKTGERDTQELVASLLRDMSEAMAELVSASDGIEDGPAEEELDALLGALQAEAIPTLVRALPAMTDRILRRQVEDALDRLILRFPRQVTRLLEAEDPMLSAEAAAIVARLGVEDAVGGLVEAARRPEAVARRAAISALGQTDSELARQVVFGALEDEEATVRVAAVQALTSLGGTEAERAIGDAVSARGFESRDTAEQMAYLKGLVAVSGDDAVGPLGELLNGRRWWGGRHGAALRASAARALALIGTPDAVAELRKAADDRTSTVAHAVRVSLRHVESEPDSTPPVEGEEA